MTFSSRKNEALSKAGKVATEFNPEWVEKLSNNHREVDKYFALNFNNALFPLFSAPFERLEKKIHETICCINKALDEFHDKYGSDVYINNVNYDIKLGEIDLDQVYFEIQALFIKNTSYDPYLKDVFICIDFLETKSSVDLFSGCLFIFHMD